jgi:hypothetical protein
MVRGAAPLALLFVMLLPTGLRAQGDSARSSQPASQGFTPFGASGLVSVLSPAVVSPGNIAVSFSRNKEAGTSGAAGTPVAIGYGVARFSEAWLGFDTRTLDASHEANELFVGLKAVGLRYGFFSFGAGGEYRLSELSGGGIPTLTNSTVTTQGILGLHLGSWVLLAGNAGYTFAPRSTTSELRGPVAGFGISIAPSSFFLLIADAAVQRASNAHPEYRASMGARFFAFDHFQITAAYQINQRDARRYSGIVVGLGFCSQLLRTTHDTVPETDLSPELPSLEDLDKSKKTPDDSQGK